jgi:3-oxoacyl-[acyl-carrier protein] reductase
MELEGRIALVTGGATGLGRAVAESLAEAGCSVAINYSRSKEEALEAAASIELRRRKALLAQADVADPTAVASMLRSVESSLGPVSILVNNAGVTEYVPFPQLDLVTKEQWERILGVNVIGAFLCAQAVAPGMLAAGGGAIVNVSSLSAFTASGSSIPYTVSKAALVSLTKCLARALAPAVRVNAVAPGWMLTRWIDAHLPPEEAEPFRTGSAPTVPVEDAADAVLAVLRNDSLNGQTLVLDRSRIVR